MRSEKHKGMFDILCALGGDTVRECDMCGEMTRRLISSLPTFFLN